MEVDTPHLIARVGNWGRATDRALGLLKSGWHVALVARDPVTGQEQVIGYLVPPQMRVTRELLLETLRWSEEVVNTLCQEGSLDDYHWVPGTSGIWWGAPSPLFAGGPPVDGDVEVAE